MIRPDTTICAVATGTGGAISVIRVSGKDCIEIVSKIFFPADKNRNILNSKGFTVAFGEIRDNGKLIDEVLLSVFIAPNSYTGENVVEISCHASPYIVNKILETLINKGASQAMPGEFTQRAFMNGKIDLSQAEAVADVIASSSAASHRLAMNQMRGGFKKELQQLRSQLLHFVSLIELELDFGEEDVEFADRNQLIRLADDIQTVIARLAHSFSVGNVLKNGVPVVIVGETNVGKSTLLNLLLNEDKAIVSKIHGTTRDAIEDVININGVAFRFIDTAGIRNPGDEVEKIGIERTFQKIEQAAIVIWMIDITILNNEIEHIADKIVPKTKHKKLFIVFNKIDKISCEEQQVFEEKFLPHVPAERIYLSAKYKKNIEKLEKALLQAANLPELNVEDVIVTNVRHYEALTKSLESVKRVQNGLTTNLSGDFIAQDIRECMHHLGEITGEITTDEILGNIFEKFCIGK